MVGKTLKLQAYAAQAVGAWSNHTSGKALQQHAVGRGMPHSGVASGAFQQRQAACERAVEQHFFDTPVLVAQGDLKVHDVFAMTLKAKMTGLNDTRVHRANGNLMDFFTINPEERIGLGLVSRGSSKGSALGSGSGVGFGCIGDTTHALEPRMPHGLDVPLLKNFAFKKMGLRRCGRHGRVESQGLGAQGGKIVRAVLRQHAAQTRRGIFFRRLRQSKQRQQPPAFGDVTAHKIAHFFYRNRGHARKRHGIAVIE